MPQDRFLVDPSDESDLQSQFLEGRHSALEVEAVSQTRLIQGNLGFIGAHAGVADQYKLRSGGTSANRCCN